AHLDILQVERRRREQLEAPHVVVMQMRDHDVLDLGSIAAQQSQSVRDAAKNRSASLYSHRHREAGIDHDLAAVTPDQPDEVVERHRPVVRIALAVEKILGRAPLVVRVLDRVNLVSSHLAAADSLSLRYGNVGIDGKAAREAAYPAAGVGAAVAA